MYHLPEIGQGHIDHFAEGYEGILEAAASGSPNVTRDSDGLQYFALEAYAYDIIAPGVGCPGPSGPPSSPTSSSSSSSAAAPTTPTATASTTASTNGPTTASTSTPAAAADTSIPDVSDGFALDARDCC